MYGDDVWRSIETLIYRDLARPEHRGDISPVVKEIEQYLGSSNVQEFLRNMGLLSIGYLFDARWNRTFQFFRGDEPQKQHYITPYLWKHHNSSKRFSLLIHALFVFVRDVQRDSLEGREYHFEEFYTFLPYIRSGGNSSERVHYCSIGELLFWLYAWRVLLYFEHLPAPSEPFGAGRVPLSQKLPDPATFAWCGREVDAPGLADAIDILNVNQWALEYRVLCLFDSETRLATPWVGAVEKYLSATIGLKSLPAADLETLDSALQSAVSEWLVRVVPEHERQTCRAARLWVEANTPAPLLPYYFWIGLDNWPKTYLVCPIWASPCYPARVPGGKDGKDTPITGLALCGVAPLSAFDTTLTTELTADFGVCSTSQRDVIEFVTMLGQPAVELNRFTILAAELTRVEREQITARHIYVLRRGLIHETGQLVHIVRGFAKQRLTEAEVYPLVWAVNQASAALVKILDPKSQHRLDQWGIIVDCVRDALRFPDLDLIFDSSDDLRQVPVPAALEYVLIEICRNAYRDCDRGDDERKAIRVSLENGGTTGHERRVRVTQRGELKRRSIDTDIDDISPEKGRGLDIVPYVVKEIMGGRFVLRQTEDSQNEVVAYVERF